MPSTTASLARLREDPRRACACPCGGASRSFGHFSPARSPVSARTASCTATPVSSGSQPHCSIGTSAGAAPRTSARPAAATPRSGPAGPGRRPGARRPARCGPAPVIGEQVGIGRRRSPPPPRPAPTARSSAWRSASVSSGARPPRLHRNGEPRRLRTAGWQRAD